MLSGVAWDHFSRAKRQSSGQTHLPIWLGWPSVLLPLFALRASQATAATFYRRFRHYFINGRLSVCDGGGGTVVVCMHAYRSLPSTQFGNIACPSIGRRVPVEGRCHTSAHVVPRTRHGTATTSAPTPCACRRRCLPPSLVIEQAYHVR